MTDPRIADLARAILNHSIQAQDVPVYDRPAVQEVLVTWWIERHIGRRVSGSPVTRTRTIRTL